MTTIPTNIDRLLAETEWLHSLACQLVSDRNRAEDIAQETLMASLEDGDQIRGGARPWLTTVARRTIARFSRTEKRRIRHERLLPSVDPSPSALDTVTKFELHRHVVESVHALSEPYRGTVLLRFWEGLPPRAIASRIGVPVETVKTQLVRGLTMLRERLDAQHGSRAAWVTPLGLWLRPSTAVGPVTSQKIVVAAALALIGLGITWVLGVWNAHTTDDLPTRTAEVTLASPSRSEDSEKTLRDTVVAPVPTGPEILVVDTYGNPLEDAVVIGLESPRPGKLSPVLQQLKQLMTSPKRDDPTPYVWIERNLEHSRTDSEGRAQVPGIGKGNGAILAFTDALDGTMTITGSDEGLLTLWLYPRRIKRVTVVEPSGAPLDDILVGYRRKGQIYHAAWTVNGSAQIPLVAVESLIAMQPESADGEFAIVLPLGDAGSVRVDLRTDDYSDIVLRMPQTGKVELVCRDQEGNCIAVDGDVELMLAGTSGQPRGPRAKVTRGQASFARVAIDMRFVLVVTINGRENPIRIDSEGLTESSRTITIPIMITEDVVAMRRAHIVEHVLREETSAERRLIQKAMEDHDEWSLNVIVSTLIGHGAFDRAIVTLRQNHARQTEYWRTQVNTRYRTNELRLAYNHFARYAPEVLIEEYQHQLGQSDLAEHRRSIVSAIGFDSGKKELSAPFALAAFYGDPDALVRATSLLSIGFLVDLKTCERVYCEAIADVHVLPHVVSKLSNFFDRADDACVRRVCAALLETAGLSENDRAVVEEILRKRQKGR